MLPKRNTVEAILARIDRSAPDSCWPYTGTRLSSGYGVAKLDGKMIRVHRLAFVHANGEPPPDRPFVCHWCNNPPCCRPDHLYADDAAGNARYMVECGRSASGDQNPSRLYPDRYPRGADHYLTRQPWLRRGERNPRAKLTEDIVRQMRADHAAGMGCVDLGKKYGVSPQVAWQAATRRTWKHVLEPSLQEQAGE